MVTFQSWKALESIESVPLFHTGEPEAQRDRADNLPQIELCPHTVGPPKTDKEKTKRGRPAVCLCEVQGSYSRCKEKIPEVSKVMAWKESRALLWRGPVFQ